MSGSKWYLPKIGGCLHTGRESRNFFKFFLREYFMGNQPAVVKKAVGSIGSGRILRLLRYRYGVEREFMSRVPGRLWL